MTADFKAILLKARHQVYTLLSGHNLSRLHGEGYDFAELREYQVGDDIRKINWTITAKLGKPYIKELHANRELSVAVAAILDGSLFVGTDNSKQQVFTEVASLLGYAAQHSGDLFTGIGYTDTGTFSTPPTKQLFEIERFCEEIYRFDALHTNVTCQNAIENLFGRIHKPSLLFVLHDFLEPVDLSVLAQRHEVIAIIIRHREEEILGQRAHTLLHDPRTGREQEHYLRSQSRRNYLARRKAHDEKLLAHFSQYGIRYVKIFTDETAVEKLVRLFA